MALEQTDESPLLFLLRREIKWRVTFFFFYHVFLKTRKRGQNSRSPCFNRVHARLTIRK